MSSNKNNARPSGSGSSSSASSPTKRSNQHLLPLPPSGARSPSPSLRSPTSPSRTLFTPPPLHLTVRFSTSLPDLHLDILTPHQTTIAALKHLIRARLAADANADDTSSSKPSTTRDSAASAAARGRLRFIHGGKILPDHAALSSVLKPLPPPPPTSSNPSDPKGKGKHVEGRHLQRVYVNCSIGDELTPAELAAEATAAAEIPPPPSSPFLGGRSTPSTPGRATGIQLDTGSGLGIRSTGVTQRAPRGFDRLLTAGFTSAEVNQLRLQFRSIQAQRHTPDTMPSPDTLRTMEDAWIDSNGAGTGGGGGGAAAGTGGEEGADAAGDDAFGLNAVIDAMIKGMFIGFVFPLGAIGWLLREEGIWPKRMQVFVSLGFLLSLSVGIVRWFGAEG
ncbi:DUF2407 C-terminal domain-containing protein [Podospora aff. communis PSN243]|uniref:DUF2407 C-terminal domain-containing protein n=1 Tax=Podospora aff. communis PSN243 TaxID=3040156 RepID=A0AAV9H5P7_9PEZI|nr:DUF2407 C-terminal domain-containing protein [Podospora aff. communis PSN243]